MKNKKVIISSVLVLLLAVGGFFIYNNFLKPQGIEGSKNIEVTVIDNKNNYNEVHKHATDAKTLGEALDEMGIIKTDNSKFGRYVTSVDDINADRSKEEWWQIKVNDNDSQGGIDETVINDGDKFKFIFTSGW